MKLKVLATGQQMSQALQAGEVQIIGSAYSNYPLAVERGMAAKGVVGLMGDRSGKYWDQSVTIWTRKGTRHHEDRGAGRPEARYAGRRHRR